jgi:c-di-GMP-binding flagellar brake protein YcgR
MLYFLVPSPNNNDAADHGEAKDAAVEEYKSRIADIVHDQIIMEIPMEEKTGKYKRLEVGQPLRGHFFSDDGVKSYFESEVIGFTEDVITLAVIRKPDPSTIKREQKRAYLRVPAKLELAVKLGDDIQFLGVTEDIGGGGISFVCDDHIPVMIGSILSCWMLIHYKNNAIEHVQFKGEVVRVKELEEETQLVMMKFIDIVETEQQKVIRYVFEKQLDVRKKS